MKGYERSIKIAVDKLTGELLDADELFKKRAESFEVRKDSNRDKIEFHCLECDQKLIVSTSLHDRNHFKHLPNSADCLLKSSEASPGEIQLISEILKAKESPRHKELKNRIGEALKSVPGVDAASIAIDNKFISRGTDKRRPDVYCKFRDKEIVFEIQLSNLSLRYILSRYDFYKAFGIYLIWILDNFDLKGQSQMERDIKYLSAHQNFFKVDESSNEFRLTCSYKVPYLTSALAVHSKWYSDSVSLDQLTYDESLYQVFFKDFEKEKSKVEGEQVVRKQAQREEEAKERLREAEKRAEQKSQSIISEIGRLRELNIQTYRSVQKMLRNLDEMEIETLNGKLKLNERSSSGKTKLNQWISKATLNDYAFFDFLLNCDTLGLDVNLTDLDGTTSFQEIRRREDTHRHMITKGLFRRGYKLTNTDLLLIEGEIAGNKMTSREMWILKLMNQLKDRTLIDQVSSHDSLLLTIESAKRAQIVGFKYKPDEWVALANNAIEHYPAYWEYVEHALKFFGIWDKIISHDHRETFKKKLRRFYEVIPDQSYDIEEVLEDLYPDFQMNSSHAEE